MRRVALVTGAVILCVAWMPLLVFAERSFTTHMVVHMAVVAAAAPLLALGVGGTAFDPVRWRPLLFAPIPASILEFLVVWAWHTPALHAVARHHAPAFVAEQASFLLAAFALWISVLGGEEPQRSSRAGAGVVALLLTSMHMTLLGALLALTPRVLYRHAGHQILNSLEDQHIGGVIMLVAGGASYVLGGLWLTSELLRSRCRSSAEYGT